MINILKEICENKSKELEETKNKCSFRTLEKLISSKLDKRPFKEKLINSQKNKQNFIIGEIKKQSPSAGEIVKDYIPEDIAIIYEKSGIGALSILTKANFFYVSNTFLMFLLSVFHLKNEYNHLLNPWLIQNINQIF